MSNSNNGQLISFRSERPEQSSGWFANRSNEFICEVQIIISLFFFGSSFIGQKQAMTNGLGPITFNACRYVVSTFLLYCVKECTGFKLSIEETESEKRTHPPIGNNGEYQPIEPTYFNQMSSRKQMFFYATLLGITNFGGSMLQQIGLVTVSAGKTGFITGMYVVFVPIFEYIFIPKYRHHMNYRIVFSVLLSFLGLYLLSGCLEHEDCIGTTLGRGEVIVFVSTFFWVVSILVSDYGAKNCEVIEMTYYEFLIATILNIAFAVYFETEFLYYPFVDISLNWYLIIIVGFTEAVSFGLATLGQMYVNPTRATILFSMEAVVCATLAFLILREKMSFIEIIGAIFMTLAALLSSFSNEETIEMDEEYEEQFLQDLEEFYEERKNKRGHTRDGDDEEFELEAYQGGGGYLNQYPHSTSGKTVVKPNSKKTGKNNNNDKKHVNLLLPQATTNNLISGSYETIDLSKEREKELGMDLETNHGPSNHHNHSRQSQQHEETESDSNSPLIGEGLLSTSSKKYYTSWKHEKGFENKKDNESREIPKVVSSTKN
jgi:drug/metabolite transporter (DMT)-like permease